MKYLRRFVRVWATLPIVVRFLYDRRTGGQYGVGVWQKLKLLVRFWRNRRRVETLSSIMEHMELAAAVLRVPASVQGDVVECGCYVGGSAVNLSLVCALVGRRLVICDSFEGLPEPREYDRMHFAVHIGYTEVYYKGRFAATIDTVKENLARYGNLAVCDFHVGFFDKTMDQLDRKVVMAFLDVDLIDSLKPCLRGLWPFLQSGCRLYVHEARNLPLVSVLFDTIWWQENLSQAAPGFVGSGVGLPLAIATSWGSQLGYAQKGGEANLAKTDSVG